MPRLDRDDRRRRLQRRLGQVRRLAVVSGDGGVLEHRRGRGETLAVGGRIAEVEGRLRIRLVAERLAEEGDVCPLVLADDTCELRELAAQRAACFGVRIERRLQLLQLQHEIEDLHVLRLRPGRRRDRRQPSEQHASRDDRATPDDGALEQARPRQAGLLAERALSCRVVDKPN